MWFVYMASYSSGKLYTGITTDPVRRIREHNSGKGAKSVRGKGLVSLVYLEEQADRGTASKRESQIKKYSRTEKMELVYSQRNIEITDGG